MIILSQDEEMIVNFDNAKVLRTAFYSNCVGIEAVLDEEYGVSLGIYKDKARAKEVLKDIVKAIEGESIIECNASELNINTIENKIFYMPKE